MERDYSGFEIESNEPEAVEEETSTGQPDGEEPKEESSKTEEGEDEPKVDEQKPRSKSRAQKRIETLAQEKRELQRELEELRRSTKSQQPQEELDPEDFDDYDDYLEAVEKQSSAKPEEKEETYIDPLSDIRDEMEAKFDEVRDKYPDFDEKVRAMPTLTVEMLHVITESDIAGEVAYYLAHHTEQAHKLAGMSPVKMAIEIGKIEDALSATPPSEPKPTPKKTTKAPDPIEPVGGAHGQPRSLSDAEDYSEYEAMRNAQSSRKTGWV